VPILKVIGNEMRVYIRPAVINILLFISHLSFAETKIIPAVKENTPVFKMWLGAGLPEMQTYDEAVLRLILKNSREKYGDYRFVTEVSKDTIKRQERIFRSSVEVAINVSPINILYNTSDTNNYAIMPHSIAKGMLGYRQLLVNKSRVEEFRHVKTLEDLQRYSIAQVSGWADIDVLQTNGIDVKVIQKYDLMFPMLKNNRFDSISVGCTETASLIKFLDKHYPDQFALVPDLVLFYPLSLYIFVNKSHSEAIDRLTYGYNQAARKGGIDKLFDSYHGDVFGKLNTPHLKIIQLKNASASAGEASSRPELLQRYPLTSSHALQ
jgi:hypothetical protein